MKMTGIYNGQEIDVWFKARGEKSDYGVPGSPTWIEPLDIEIEALEILGVEVKPADLPSDLVDAIHGLSEDVRFEA